MRANFKGSRWVLAAAIAMAGLLTAVVTSSGSAAPTATTTTTTTGTTTAATTTAATTTTATTTAAAAPQNTSPPTISGTPQEDATLTAQTGSWSGTAPITYAYQWTRCNSQGGSCADVVNATTQTYKLTSADVGNTVRVRVTGTNSAGSSASTSAPSAVIAKAAPTAPPAPPTGCPTAAKGQVADVSQVSAPARLQISAFQSNPAKLGRDTQAFTLRVVVSDTCGHPVKGALVYATAVPFEQFSIPAEQATGADGSITLSLHREARYPASPRQELLAMFLRARKPGDNVLGGISTRRLVSVPVSLRG